MKLLTFGSSWTQGTGAGYIDGMTLAEYKTACCIAGETTYDKDKNNPLTWKNLLAEKNGWELTTYARVGSSNMRNFRQMTEVLDGTDAAETIVLVGVPHLARHEIYMNDDSVGFNASGKGYVGVLYANGYGNNANKLKTKDFDMFKYVKNHYSEANELEQLSYNIAHWNRYLTNLGYKVFWYDELNQTKYTTVPDNYLFTDKDDRSLLTMLAVDAGWTPEEDTDASGQSNHQDCKRTKYLVEKKAVNPHAILPTAASQAKIADWMDAAIKAKM